jgi:uncharacterized protein (DUF1501 family)
VIPITSLNPDGHTYGLHPSCPELATLFGEGKLAMLLNVGPLTYPLTRAQYNSGPKPPQLFSHSDQVTHWQTSLPDQPPNTGWGGRIADLIHPLQYQLVGGVPTASSAKIALCSSVGGTNTFEVGHNYAQYRVSSTSGAVTVSGLSASHLQAMKDILAISSADLANLQRSAYSGVVENAILVGQTLNSAIAASGAAGFFNVAFPGTSLGNQMKMIARLIHGRTALNMKRQIFFATVGGYDTHTAQVGNGANPTDTALGAHANLLNEVSKSLFAFQRAMEQIGTSNMVTSFYRIRFLAHLPHERTGQRPCLGQPSHDHGGCRSRAAHLWHSTRPASRGAGCRPDFERRPLDSDNCGRSIQFDARQMVRRQHRRHRNRLPEYRSLRDTRSRLYAVSDKASVFL